MTPAIPTTRAQEVVLEAIRAHIASHGYPPTWRQLGDALGISSTKGFV